MGQGGYRVTASGFVFDPADPTLPYKNTPVPGFAGRFDSDATSNGPIYTQFLAAQTARQQLADDIYRRLLKVTRVAPAANPATPSTADLKPRRWLAQLAANIVDYIDEDDVSTPFNFYNTADGIPAANINDTSTNAPTSPECFKHWVFGTELPRVVLNEALAEYTKVGPPPTPPTYSTKFFAELYCPIPTGTATTNPLDSQPVPLYVNPTSSLSGFSPYRISVIAGAPSPFVMVPGPTPATNSADTNVVGSFNAAVCQTTDGSTPMQDFAQANASTVVHSTNPTAPMSIGGTSSAYVLVGDPPTNPGQGPDAHHAIDKNVGVPDNTPYVQTVVGMGVGPTAGSLDLVNQAKPPPPGTKYTILLRRLVNPYLPPPPPPSGVTPPGATPNPYCTIDFIENVLVNNGTVAGPYSTTGKKQPYSNGGATPYANQTVNPGNGTKNTFGLKNDNGTGSYATPQWLTHLDRQLVSPMELLEVSGVRPHELTHNFHLAGAPPLYQHLVRWWDQGLAANQSHRLYRIFEFLDTHSRMAGVSPFGRIPGRINLNTIWDKEIFYALCDAQAANHFTGPGAGPMNDTDNAWTAFVSRRTPSLATTGISQNDVPLFNLSIGTIPYAANDPLTAGYTPNGLGVNDTFLAVSPSNANERSFEAASATTNGALQSLQGHPYIKYELMNKIYNNVTTRSNVFAIWITVGFFQVTDDQALPVKLGAEIGAAQNTNVRHRMFAIVDRSNLAIAPSLTTLTANATAGAQQSLQLSSISGTTANGIPWQITAGTVLVLDAGLAQETVVVTGADAMGNPLADLKYPHAAGTNVTIPGNPGPQSAFNAADPNYSAVVPYFVVLQ
jgi:hypothetical protein